MHRRGTTWALVLAVLLLAACGPMEGAPSPDRVPAAPPGPGPASTPPPAAAVGEEVVPVADELERVSERIFGPGATLALVHRRPPEQVLALLAPDAVLPLTTAAQARRWAEQSLDVDVEALPSALLAGQVGDWTVVWEDNGFRATDKTLLRQLSENTRAVVVFQSADGPSSIQYAVDGQIVRSFDPVLYDNRSLWSGDRLPEETGLTFEIGDAMADALRLAERLTGLRLTVDDVTRLEDRIGVGILI